MAQELLETIYSTGPDDALTVVDVYAKIDTKVTAAIPDTSSPMAAIAAPPSVGAEAVDAAIVPPDEPTGEPAPDASRVKDALGDNAKNLKLTEALAAKIYKQMEISDKVPKTKIEDALGNVLSKNKSASLSDVRTLTDIITTLYCDRYGSIRDTSAYDAANMGLISSAIGLGTSELLDCLLANIPKLNNNMLIRELKPAIETGDIKSIASVSNITGTSALLSVYPNIIQDTLSNFAAKPVSDGKSKQVQSSELVTNLDTIDTNWRVKNRSGIPTDNLTPLSDMSSDAHDLLVMDEDVKVSAMIADSYNLNDIITIARNTYTKMSA